MTTTYIRVRTIIQSIVAALGIWAALALGGLAHGGDEMGSFDYSGNYNYHQYQPPSSLRPSIGQEGYDSAHRRELQADQWEHYRQEPLRQMEESRASAAKPVEPNPYNFPEAVITPNGTMLCTKGFQGQTYCH